MSTHVASVGIHPMVLAIAKSELDPHSVVTPLDYLKVEDTLCEYNILDNWCHIVNSIHNGFHVGVPCLPESTILFQKSCILFTKPFCNQQLHYFKQAAGCYSIGYSPTDLECIIGPFRTSPLGLVPKPHSNKFHIVQDLSYPCNDPSIHAVNADISADNFPTVWGTFNNTAAPIPPPPHGCVAATFDISSAYCIIPVLPWQQNSLCIFWKGIVYVDRALMFGLTSSAGIFGSVANMLVTIYSKAGFSVIQKWVDDFLIIRLLHQSWTKADFIAISAIFGVPWSLEKLRRFISIQCYIRFDWDLN